MRCKYLNHEAASVNVTSIRAVLLAQQRTESGHLGIFAFAGRKGARSHR
jgi:hypothetical protein